MIGSRHTLELKIEEIKILLQAASMYYEAGLSTDKNLHSAMEKLEYYSLQDKEQDHEEINHRRK